jgi:hypothetical protein
MTKEQLHELLNRACDLITSLEGFIGYNDGDYRNSDLSKSVDKLFDEIDYLNEEDTGPEYDSAGFTEEDRIVNGQYRNYVDTVKRNIDQAVADGILKSGTECVSYSYMSEEGFNKRIETDPEFAAQWADLEAQDYDTFGEKKV